MTLWLSEIGTEDARLVGGKIASLGEMYNHLTPLGVRIPNAYDMTRAAHQLYVSKTGIWPQILAMIRELDPEDRDLLNAGHVSTKIRRLILNTPLPDEFTTPLFREYRELEKQFPRDTAEHGRLDVAVRSSAIGGDDGKGGEDSKEASFAGQFISPLNIRGEVELANAVHECIASNYGGRVLLYRRDLNYDLSAMHMSVGVQKMVRSDKHSQEIRGASGIIFTLDRSSGFRDIVEIVVGFGLGEPICRGSYNADAYLVFKPTLAQGYRPIISRTIVQKSKMLVCAFSQGETTREVAVPRESQLLPAISDDDILQLAKWAVIIENHFKCPVDIEWAKDGGTGELFVVQARPETYFSRKDQ